MPIESHAKILVVEDDATVRNLVLTALEAQSFDLLAESTGRGAIASAATNAPDVVLLDLGLPDIDGIEVVRAIRVWSQMPIIVVSARSEDADKIAALDAGADDYLTKPFHSRELLARIRAMTRTQSSQTSSVLQMGNITLDQRTYELSSPTGSFRLANREFQILELLMQNPGNLISAERLMEKIWGYDSETEISVVWVYISYLRKKLSALGANIQIRATRNVGYCLEEIA